MLTYQKQKQQSHGFWDNYMYIGWDPVPLGRESNMSVADPAKLDKGTWVGSPSPAYPAEH